MSRKLPDWIEGYLEYASNTEPPRIFHKWVAVSVIAAALRRKVKLQYGIIPVYPNFYIVLVAPPGRARKGTAMSLGADFLYSLGIRLAAEATTREALIRELRESSDTTVDPQTGRITPHASLTVYSQEFAVFLGYNNPQFLSDLADWYDCRDRWRYRTKTQGTDDITGVWVNLIGATTPDLLQSLLPNDAVGGGLTSRIIFVYAENKEKTVVLPFLSKEQLDLKEKLLDDLNQINMLQGEFKITEDWLELWASWYPTQEREINTRDSRLALYASRRPTHAIKLSMIMSASRSDAMIVTGEDLKKAISLLKETERGMEMVFAGIGKSETVSLTSKVMAALNEAGELTFSELLRRFYHDADKETMARVVATLEAMRACQIVHQGGEIYVRRRSANLAGAAPQRKDLGEGRRGDDGEAGAAGGSEGAEGAGQSVEDPGRLDR